MLSLSLGLFAPLLRAAVAPAVKLRARARAQLTLVIGALTAASSAVAQQQPEPPGRLVREFLEDPPRFRALVLERSLASAPISFRDRRQAEKFAEDLRAGKVAAPGQTSLFEIRFQSDPPGYFLRALNSLEDVDNPGAPRLTPFAGRYQTNWWAILDVTPPQIQLLRSSNGVDVGADGRPNSYHRENERWATEFLRLGMFDVRTETARWISDNVFEAEREDGGRRRGEVSRLNDDTIQIRLPPAGSQSGYQIQIVATHVAGRWAPRQMAVDTLLANGAENARVPYAAFNALAMDISPEPLEPSRFSPEPYLQTNDLWVEIERGEFYVLEPAGTNLVRVHAPVEKTRTWTRLLRPAFVVIVAVAIAALALRIISERRRQLRSKAAPRQ
jgi:hypothetical protein